MSKIEIIHSNNVIFSIDPRDTHYIFVYIFPGYFYVGSYAIIRSKV